MHFIWDPSYIGIQFFFQQIPKTYFTIDGNNLADDQQNIQTIGSKLEFAKTLKICEYSYKKGSEIWIF